MTTKTGTTQSRLDAQDRYFLTQELQGIDPNKYYHLVPGIVGRRVIAPIEGVSPELPVYKWKMTKLLGTTKRRGPKSRMAPTAAVVRTEETQQILTHEESFGWTVDEVRAARKAGENLPEDRQLAAITNIEQWVDGVLCTGETDAGVFGLANNPNVLNTNAAGVWTAATVDAILQDLTTLVEDTSSALKQAQIPGQQNAMYDQFVLFISAARYRRLMTTKLGANNDTSLLKYIRENFEMIKRFVPWWRLDTANGGNPMAVLAPALDNGSMNPMAGGALLPQDYEQLPEQYEGRNVVVPAAGKCGGVVIRHAVGFRTLKGL
jgi:hypothetical protein